MISLRPAQEGEAAWLQESFDAVMGWTKPAGYFKAVIEQQKAGALLLLIALESAKYLGHCKVVWRSNYPGFRENNIPEIQDLNVGPDYRRRGIGGRLLAEAEARITLRSAWAGIGFGLYADYGAAQRLYIKRGYVPDGRGAHYAGAALAPGQPYPADDNLALYLVKRLTP